MSHGDEGWRAEAACRQSHPDLFFANGFTGAHQDDNVAAKCICRVCVVRVPCLEFALRTAQEYGVWGGLTEVERRPLLRIRRRAGLVAPIAVGP